MAAVLRDEWGLTRVWQEGLSKNTRENARYTAELLGAKGIERILLVSHALHLPRAVPEFERQGLSVLPAPTGFTSLGAAESLWLRWLPTAAALEQSGYVLHEWMGIAVYGVLSDASVPKSSI